MQKNYLIIGTSAAGIGAANKLRQLDPTSSITLVTDELESPYNKCFLADYLSGLKSEEQIGILTSDQRVQKNFTIIFGVKSQRVDTTAKTVHLSNGYAVSYDQLLIASGTSPVKPLLPGIDACGVFLFHGMKHALDIENFIAVHRPQHAVVIGAGLSGLECADSLAGRGLSVKVIERGSQLLGRQVDADGAKLIQEHMTRANVELYTNNYVTEILEKNNQVIGVRLDSGITIDADMVICALGVRPNTDFLDSSVIVLQDGRILVDSHLQTNVPGVFAAGDVILVTDQITGRLVPSCTWSDSMYQGMLAAQAMLGHPKPYTGTVVITSSAFFGIKFATCGPIHHLKPEYEVVRVQDDTSYKFFLLEDNELRGFLIVAPHLHLGGYRRALIARQHIDRQQLIDESL